MISFNQEFNQTLIKLAVCFPLAFYLFIMRPHIIRSQPRLFEGCSLMPSVIQMFMFSVTTLRTLTSSATLALKLQRTLFAFLSAVRTLFQDKLTNKIILASEFQDSRETIDAAQSLVHMSEHFVDISCPGPLAPAQSAPAWLLLSVECRYSSKSQLGKSKIFTRHIQTWTILK